MNNQFKLDSDSSRRSFIETTLKVALVSGLVGATILSGCKEKEDGDSQKVSQPEDLMQEHGILKRVMLIYDACRIHLINKESFPIEALSNSATIIRTFIEDYHEKQEEN